MAIITLLTDFGIQDEYVGVLKGVILGIHPRVNLVDLTHCVPPQNILAAGHTLRSAYGYFPEGTLHLTIVDPGVGSDRSIIAAQYDGHLFLAPDNGLLPMVWRGRRPDAMVRVENDTLFQHPVSHTFHGRDIFAPVAARLSKNDDLNNPDVLSELGPPLMMDQVCHLKLSDVSSDPSVELKGEVVSVDRFGNLITDIEASQVQKLLARNQGSGIVIQVGDARVRGLCKTYQDGEPQKTVALIGSRDCIEIAVSGGSAARLLGVSYGTKVVVK